MLIKLAEQWKQQWKIDLELLIVLRLLIKLIESRIIERSRDTLSVLVYNCNGIVQCICVCL